MHRRVMVVVLSVRPSVCLLPQSLLHTSYIRRKQGVIGFFMVFQGFCHVAFAENASFKSSGVICQLSLPFSTPDEHPMDRTECNRFFSMQIVCTISDSTYNTLITAH